MNKFIIFSISAIALLMILFVTVFLTVTIKNERVLPPAPDLGPPLEDEVADISEEEYAIEFEGSSEEELIDANICELIRAECDKQGIIDCVDYDLCLENINLE